MSPALCGFCQDSLAETFCEADDAFLCSSCDHRVHSANKLASRHRRTPLCHACKRAPASLKPSGLCRTCDQSPIPPDHLSSRHFRTPTPAFVEIPKPNPNPNPNPNTNHSPSPSPNPDRVINCLKYEPGPGPPPCVPLRPAGDVSSVVPDLCQDERDGESASEEESVAWLFSDHAKNMDKDLGFFEESFLLSNIFTHCDQNGKERDCVVPVVISPFPPPKQDDTFTNHSISSSSLDTGLVPDATTVSETSTILRPVDPVPIFDPLDREARVLRYKEKRKNRQFTKTIRYASRKAYAEARPRIKGRFVKQPAAATATEANFTWLMQDESGFGVVPSF